MERKTIVEGEPVPMALQLHDGDPNRKCEARVYDSSYTRRAVIPLVHRALGLYVSLSYLAPDDDMITIQYIVEQSADEDGYENVIESYYILPKPTVEERAVSGYITSKKTDYIEGVISEVKNQDPAR